MRTRISAAQVITGDGTVYDDGAVLVEDDRIVAVGNAEDVPGDADREYALPGHTVMPGLIDAHVHLGGTGNPDVFADELGRSPTKQVVDAVTAARTTVEAGVTSVRDVGSQADVAVVVRDEVAAGNFPGPRIVACGQGLSATGGHGILSPWYVDRDESRGLGRVANGVSAVQQAVREQLQKDADAIKVWASGGVIDPEGEIDTMEYSQAELDAIVAEADRHNVHVASHAHPPNAIQASVEAGVRSVEHGMYVDEPSMEAMAENDVFLVLTMAVMDTLTRAEGVPEYYRTNTEEAVEYRRSQLPTAEEKGVTFAMGTDAGAPTLPHGENALELECMVDAGIAPLDAIEISTRQTADLLELDDVGVLAEGMAADLLAVAGDPLDDVTVLRDQDNVELVAVGGRTVKDETGA